MDADGCGWMWMDVDGYGRTRKVSDGYCWIGMDVEG